MIIQQQQQQQLVLLLFDYILIYSQDNNIYLWL
jgi:hypothetical protein